MLTALLFRYLHAPNSRERLYASREMLSYLLTYHQVMPSFLDFLFPFGRQEHARDLNFTGFRHESRLEPIYNGLSIQELGRSGRELRMCYSLKSAEPSNLTPTIPWSIRQTAVYHSLDVETGNAFWIILKGDELIKERIEDSFEYSGGLGKLEGERQQRNALSESLATHLIICDWCGEDWRWYISYLEESLQEKTRQTLAVVVDAPLNPTPEKPSKAVTWSSVSSAYAEKKSMRSSKVCKSEKGLQEPPLRAQSDPLAPQPRGQSTHLNTIYSQNGSKNPTKFKFADLQQIQLVEDRANEVLLILESNASVLADLKAHYESIFQSQHCPLELVRDCKRDIERFNLRVGSVINDLQMQRARTTTLLRMIADRKSLVSCTMFYLLGLISNDSKLYGILDFQSMEASKILALKAQESTENMEVMTKDMHILAQKTKQETVSMRIITLVTLFFLPGTFISVSLLAVTLHFSSVSSLPISCTPGHQS